MTARTVDARGMRCPWPALRLAKAMRDVAEGEPIRLLADDPAAPREIAALATQHGWALDRADPQTFVVISRNGGIAADV